MKLITRDTDYAVRSLCYLAASGGKIVPVTDLVKQLIIPRPFLRKILQRLHKNGILKAYKGQGGGFQLSYPADKILLVDLIRIFQGPLELNRCLFKKKVCPDRSNCVLRSKINAIERQVISQLKAINIESLR